MAADMRGGGMKFLRWCAIWIGVWTVGVVIVIALGGKAWSFGALMVAGYWIGTIADRAAGDMWGNNEPPA